jgi:DNA-binding transcriptional MocR family regulator
MRTLPQLDPRSEEPIYRQLWEFMREEILSGRLAKGEKLPPTRELAGQLGLNRATVAAAYELLESEGLIRGHVGRGSFVEGPGGRRDGGGAAWEARLTGQAAQEAPPPMALGAGGISFASARPAEDLFPLEAFRETCREVTGGADAASILQLGPPQGYPPLRRWLLARARESGEARPGDDLAVTNGCQQALDLLERLLVEPGAAVAVEDPVYPGLRNLFAGAGARLLGVPVGPQGMDLDALERVLAREKPRLVIVTPNFQNPTGASMPLAARKELIRLARAASAAVIENDIYGELRYEGEPLPTLKQLDEHGDVIQIRSFSKIAFPGLRVGWVTGPQVVVARLAALKQLTDLHSDQLSQAVLLRFAESGRLAEHRKKILEAGSARLRAVLRACERSLPRGARFTRPQGGMNVWVRLPEPLDAGALLESAVRENVNYLPGRFFAVSRPEPGALRLSFAHLPPERIESGVAALGRVFKAELERARTARREELAPAIV